ncbi:hypothetical protein GIB67_007311 [Kingdonia uniflora]|uniref:Uncharacterized protein n=1 Tax=Kingdonia uniflora TaxID=39325 RepID=A0A7J7NXJ1_9MAGN|nr:hypothetical protein GIB67_007311 [Kingdonia uniflora]
MKFGKEFKSQMVPEWQEAYMNYDYLKTALQDISFSKKPQSSDVSLKRKGSLYRTFSGLTRKYSNAKIEDEENRVIQVDGVGVRGEHYQTMFFKLLEEGGEYEAVFFKRLDDEFNKVLRFYKAKEEEVLIEAQEFEKQMDVLIALRIKVEKPDGVNVGASQMEMAHMDVITEVERSKEEFSKDEDMILEKAEENMKLDSSRPDQLEVLKQVKINIKPETPWSTLQGILKDSKSKKLNFSKEELREVEEQLKHAFIEFYQKLRLLKSYSFLNLSAFSKIMKKYDKIASRCASKAYLKTVDKSHLGNSDEVPRLIERVETTFIKHFSNANRGKGIRTLRPTARKEKHRTTFLLGFLSGCSVALVVAIIVLIHAKNVFQSEGRHRYMENMFPLYSLFAFVVLHMLMYSADIYFWRRYRVNYPFIFGFKQSSELGYREVFLLSAGLSVLALAGVLSNLQMDMDLETNSFEALTELVPLGLVTVVLIITFCPFNVIYRSSRIFLFGCAFRCICAPLYKVTLPDFFLADELTSQVQAFRSLEFYVCYYGWGDFQKRNNSCRESDVFNAFYFVVALIPYWYRVLQCLRRLFEEKEVIQGFNCLKYFSTIVAVVMRTVYETNKGISWRIMAGVTSGIAALYSTYWDLKIDWGLLQRHSKNPWLRDKLLVPHQSIYFAVMVLNVLLRFAWLQSVLGFHDIPHVHRTAVTAIVACLEIIRRGIWNFFRLENEHLNNVGKYRAFNSVPLPFNYGEDEDKNE